MQIRVGYVPGVMPAKWFDRWGESARGAAELIAEQVTPDAALAGILDGSLDGAITREASIDGDARESLHWIGLYEESRVVMMDEDHDLSLEDEISPDALETLTTQTTEISSWDMEHWKSCAELVAAGLGPIVVPASLARSLRRGDVVVRPVATDSAELTYRIGFAFLKTADSDLIQDFVGVLRGRTSASSRKQSTTESNAPKQAAREKPRRGSGVRKPSASQPGGKRRPGIRTKKRRS